MKTVTLVLQRTTPPKPRGLHIPFWGRRRGSRTKKISLDRLWEIHYRLERLRKTGLTSAILKSPVKPHHSDNNNNTGRARTKVTSVRAVVNRKVTVDNTVKSVSPVLSTAEDEAPYSPSVKKRKSYYVKKGGWGGARVKGSKKNKEKEAAARSRSNEGDISATRRISVEIGSSGYDEGDGGVNRSGSMKGRQSGSIGHQRSPEL
jgi:hypothetical protein